MRLPTQHTHTVRLATVARLCVVAIPVDVVVERELFVLGDVSSGEDAHADVLPNGPFRDVAVRATAVIGEPADAAPLSRIDVLCR